MVKSIAIISRYGVIDRAETWIREDFTIIEDQINIIERIGTQPNSWFEKLTLFEHNGQYFIANPCVAGQKKDRSSIYGNGIGAIYTSDFILDYLNNSLLRDDNTSERLEFIAFIKLHMRNTSIDRLLN